jgi:hypothetical protein
MGSIVLLTTQLQSFALAQSTVRYRRKSDIGYVAPLRLKTTPCNGQKVKSAPGDESSFRF